MEVVAPQEKLLVDIKETSWGGLKGKGISNIPGPGLDHKLTAGLLWSLSLHCSSEHKGPMAATSHPTLESQGFGLGTNQKFKATTVKSQAVHSEMNY